MEHVWHVTFSDPVIQTWNVLLLSHAHIQPQDLSSSPVMTQPSHQGVQQALHCHGNSLGAKNSVALWQSCGPWGSLRGGWGQSRGCWGSMAHLRHMERKRSLLLPMDKKKKLSAAH